MPERGNVDAAAHHYKKHGNEQRTDFAGHAGKLWMLIMIAQICK